MHMYIPMHTRVCDTSSHAHCSNAHALVSKVQGVGFRFAPPSHSLGAQAFLSLAHLFLPLSIFSIVLQWARD